MSWFLLVDKHSVYSIKPYRKLKYQSLAFLFWYIKVTNPRIKGFSNCWGVLRHFRRFKCVNVKLRCIFAQYDEVAKFKSKFRKSLTPVQVFKLKYFKYISHTQKWLVLFFERKIFFCQKIIIVQTTVWQTLNLSTG